MLQRFHNVPVKFFDNLAHPLYPSDRAQALGLSALCGGLFCDTTPIFGGVLRRRVSFLPRGPGDDDRLTGENDRYYGRRSCYRSKYVTN